MKTDNQSHLQATLREIMLGYADEIADAVIGAIQVVVQEAYKEGFEAGRTPEAEA